MKLFNLNKKKAQKLHDQGQSFSDEGNDEEAIRAYLKAIELDPNKSVSFYNIGLIYKYQGEWEKSLKYNAKAYELDPEDDAARWNLAIAATALHKWDVARSAWKDNGIDIEGYSGPINMNFGMTPIRLNPDDSGEVVWATRIDPIRAKIDSIPYKESGFKYGDTVLHDGAAVGSREVGEIEYPVFNALELFEASSFKTVIASVVITSDENLKILDDMFSQTKHEFEDWTSNIRAICRQCSEGKPHEHHDQDFIEAWTGERTLGIAVAENEPFLQIFEEWKTITNAKLVEFD